MFCSPLYVGLPSILMPPEAFLMKPIRWLKAISKYKATTSGGPNFAYDLCVKKIKPEQLANLDLSSWDLAYSGAEPVRAETLEQFNTKFAECGFNYSAFYPCYGMAETTLFTTGGNKHRQPVIKKVSAGELKFNSIVESQVSDSESRTFVGVGRSYIDTKVVIVNPDSLTRCESEQVGEIWVRGGSVASGYWNSPQATKETFQAYLKNTESDSFLRTGDLGFFSKGELFVTGRLKDLIIIRGRNYYPQDIELTVENSHPALRNYCSAAFSIELAGKEHLAIACEVKRTYLRKLNIDEVVQAIKTAVSTEHQLEVDRLVLLKTGTIPKTSSGKIQRRTCKLELLLDRLNIVGQWDKGNAQTLLIGLPSTSNGRENNPQNDLPTAAAISAWLTDKIAELLQIAPETIDSKQPLAVYGLDSVKAVTIAAELEAWLGISVAPTIAYDYPSIQALADYLGQRTPATTSAFVSHPQTATEAVAIIGKGCRFPKAKNPQAFWSLLRSGNDAITKVPDSRWESNNGWGGFLSQVDRFDAQFFSISPREASNIDPQQRLLLEVSWSALENAGLASERLAGSRGGVFIGISNGDYANLGGNLTNTEAYYGTGNALSIAANRLSYFLDWRGPSLAIDTACSSSLVAVHQACQSLIHGECNLALAGGVNLMLTPQLTMTFDTAQMMAADGRCKTFDASADGYVRGEGCGVVVLKRLSDAIADGDNIQAVIKGSAVNQDGQTNGLTAPNGKSQQEVIRLALAKAGVEPNQISYVETHGTGTSLGDPIEVNSLKAVLMSDRESDRPCWLGSVKTNIGHLEAAAGIAGLIKLVLSLEHGEIPPHLHLKELNPYIELDRTPIKIPRQLQPWLSLEQTRIAGVSAFGFGGTNAHVVVEEAPKLGDWGDKVHLKRLSQILTLSAKCEAALQELVGKYQKTLESNSTVELADICFTANTGRSHFDRRLAIITSDKQELTDKLTKISAGKEPLGVFSKELPSNNKTPKIAFLFTGQGSQYIEMGRELYETQPLFKQTLEQCDRLLQPLLEKSILDVIYPEDSQTLNNSLINQTAYTQPALFAIEYALYTLWQSWGIQPDVVMGHSVGEYVAACVAGVFCLEDGLKLIAHRGRLMQDLPAGGEMVSVMASLETVERVIEPYKDQVVIAAINGTQSVVISGVAAAVRTVQGILTASEIKTKQLQVSHAFHSPMMKPMLAEFAAVAERITYHQPTIPIVTNLTGKLADESIATASHWVNHICQSVKFAQSMQTLHREGYEVFVEIGAKPILLGMGRQCLSENEGIWLPSLRNDRSNWQQMLESLAQLYVRGVTVDWSGFDNDYVRNKVSLPTYPFQRQRYWIDSEDKSQKGDLSAKNKTTNIVDWLNDGNTQQLAQQLEKVGKFSPEQVKLLPELLETLIEQHQEQLTAATIEDWFYQVTWKPLPAKPSKTAIEPGHLLIFADTTGVGEKLAQQLRQQGCECSLVYRGTGYKQLEQDTYQLDPTEPEEFDRLIDAIAQNGKLSLTRVIHLWSLDAPSSEDLTTASLEQAQLGGCGAVLHLVQALSKIQNSPKLWLITKGTRSVKSQTESVSIAASSLWGMGKVIALENPELWGGAIDLDSQSPELATETLLELLADSDRLEDNLALRGDKIYVPRLVKQSPITSQAVSLKSAATYLITGGLGALGLQTASWMVDKGAKHLVLTGRKQPSAKAQEVIERLENVGVQISVLCGDISQQEDVTKILSEISASLPTLRGVIHAAGLLDDGLLQQISWEKFTRVMLPKVQGTWHLHTLTQDLPLDFFVCFSSMASLLGSLGQGNYAAANAFMDALVHYRRSQGLPGLSINWGAWAEVGMASRLGNNYQNQMAASGINFITPKQGMNALDRLISTSESQIGLFNIDWHRFEQQLPQNITMPLLEELISVQPVLAQSNRNSFLSELKQASVAKRENKLSNYLQDCVAQVLGMETDRIDLEQPLISLGVDSLMAMEIRNRVQTDLEIDIPITKFMEEVDIATLTIELNEQLTQIAPPPNLVSATESKTSTDTYPLSYGQKALWFLWKLEPLSSAYNLTYTCRISSSVNLKALQEAWQILCDRHPLLHSIFIQGETEPVQKLVPSQELDFKAIDVSNLSHSELEQQVKSESQRPFDLEHQPVIRLRLFQLAAAEHILLLTIHHIAVDGLSRGILVEEFQLIYQALLSNTKPALPPLQNTYQDYVRWQRDLLAGESGEKLWQYWEKKLGGDLPVLNLPTDKPRPPVQTYNGASVRFHLSEQLTKNLKQLAKQEKVTLYTLLLAVYNVLLYRYTGQEDILVGTPTSGRTRSEFVSLVGYFVDPVVMRANLIGNPSFSDFLSQIRHTAIAALAHQDFPFALLVERLQPDRELSHSPIFQTTFDLYNLKQFASLPTFLDKRTSKTRAKNRALGNKTARRSI